MLDARDQQESGPAVDLGTACALDTKLAKLTVRQARKQSQIKHLEDSGRPNSNPSSTIRAHLSRNPLFCISCRD